MLPAGTCPNFTSSQHVDNKRVTVPADGFPAGEIGDVDKGVVEGSVDVSYAKHKLSLTNLQERNIHIQSKFSF